MDASRFDRLALGVAEGRIPRRTVLRLAVVAAVGSVLAPLRGLVPASAAETCDEGERRVPLRDAAHHDACPKKVPKEDYSPTYNGCGPDGLDYAIPDSLPGVYDFYGPCQKHDVCYGTCGKTQQQCDDDFLQGMLAYCSQRHGVRWSTLGFECRRLAGVYHRAVAGSGLAAWKQAQVEGCDCCEKQCVRCNCNGQTYTDVQQCLDECEVTLGCFTGICEPVSSEMCE